MQPAISSYVTYHARPSQGALIATAVLQGKCVTYARFIPYLSEIGPQLKHELCNVCISFHLITMWLSQSLANIYWNCRAEVAKSKELNFGSKFLKNIHKRKIVFIVKNIFSAEGRPRRQGQHVEHRRQRRLQKERQQRWRSLLRLRRVPPRRHEVCSLAALHQYLAFVYTKLKVVSQFCAGTLILMSTQVWRVNLYYIQY